jgi:hypothetical protein
MITYPVFTLLSFIKRQTASLVTSTLAVCVCQFQLLNQVTDCNGTCSLAKSQISHEH